MEKKNKNQADGSIKNICENDTANVDEPKTDTTNAVNENGFPTIFPFWARFKPDKKRTTLVIDEEFVINKKNNKQEDCFVHREATHSVGRGEEIKPNPDKDDNQPMYLKRATKKPKRMFEPHNKNLDMPEHLKKKYEKNNNKKK